MLFSIRINNILMEITAETVLIKQPIKNKYNLKLVYY